MKNSKSTKKALFASILSLLLCFTMLIGTTFAWFTDTVTSANNIIMSGNLDIELEYWNGEKWADVKGASDILTNTLWEPGAAEVAYLRVKNAGTLALKYKLGINIVSETKGVNADGQEFKLSDYIQFGVVGGVNGETDAFDDRITAIDSVYPSKLISSGYGKTGSLAAGSDPVYLALVVYMPVEVDNVANYKTSEDANDPDKYRPEIDLGINVMATQVIAENDSFGVDYDEDALICDILATPETLAEIMANAKPGTVIGLSAGRYKGEIKIPQDGLTLVANDACFDSININGHDDITLDGIEFQAFFNQIETTSWDSGKNTKTGYVASITNTTSTSRGGNNIVIRNCLFETNLAWLGQGYDNNYDPAKYCAINIEDAGRKSGTTTNVTIEGCTFGAEALNHIRLGYVSGEIIVKDNVFSAPTSHSNINASGNKGNWTITGNTFSSWNDGDYAFGTGRDAKLDGTDPIIHITIANNSFNKAMTAGETTPVLSIKNKYTAVNSVIVIKDNEFNAGTATLGERDETGKYWMTAEKTSVGTYEDVFAGLKNGEDVFLVEDVNNNKVTVTNGYGATAFNMTNGGTFDGNGHTLTGSGLGNKWDSVIRTTGGTIKNVYLTGAMRGIFVTGGNGEKVILENVTSDCIYTISCDDAKYNGLEATNCTFNGWTSYSAKIGDVSFTNCSFGKANGDAFLRNYAATTFVGCDFAAGYVIDADAAVTFENCTIGGVAITAENVGTLVTSGIANVTVI